MGLCPNRELPELRAAPDPEVQPPAGLLWDLRHGTTVDRVVARFRLRQLGAELPPDVPDPERDRRTPEELARRHGVLRNRFARERERAARLEVAWRGIPERLGVLEELGLGRRVPSFSRYVGISCENDGAQRLTSGPPPEMRPPGAPSEWREGVAWALRELGMELGWDGGFIRAGRWLDCGRAGLELLRECVHQGDGALYAPMRCDLRTCPDCARKRAAAVSAQYGAVLEREVAHHHRRGGSSWTPKALPSGGPTGRAWRLVTLTRKNTHGYDPEELRGKVRETRRLFRVFWDSTWGSYRVERVRAAEAGVGAVWSVEVAGPKCVACEEHPSRCRCDDDPLHTRGGMVHVHVLVYGHYWPQEDLARLWEELTGDSWIVRIQNVQPRHRDVVRAREEGRTLTPAEVLEGAVKETLKYSTKSLGGVSGLRELAAVEYALEGTRRLGALGIFYNKVALTKEDPEFSPETKELGCPVCGAPIQAGRVWSSAWVARAIRRGDGAWHPDVAPQPPP